MLIHQHCDEHKKNYYIFVLFQNNKILCNENVIKSNKTQAILLIIKRKKNLFLFNYFSKK